MERWSDLQTAFKRQRKVKKFGCHSTVSPPDVDWPYLWYPHAARFFLFGWLPSKPLKCSLRQYHDVFFSHFSYLPHTFPYSINKLSFPQPDTAQTLPPTLQHKHYVQAGRQGPNLESVLALDEQQWSEMLRVFKFVGSAPLRKVTITPVTPQIWRTVWG